MMAWYPTLIGPLIFGVAAQAPVGFKTAGPRTAAPAVTSPALSNSLRGNSFFTIDSSLLFDRLAFVHFITAGLYPTIVYDILQYFARSARPMAIFRKKTATTAPMGPVRMI
jgi:hypothetical protein